MASESLKLDISSHTLLTKDIFFSPSSDSHLSIPSIQFMQQLLRLSGFCERRLCVLGECAMPLCLIQKCQKEASLELMSLYFQRCLHYEYNGC